MGGKTLVSPRQCVPGSAATTYWYAHPRPVEGGKPELDETHRYDPPKTLSL